MYSYAIINNMIEVEPKLPARQDVVFGTLPDGSMGQLDQVSNIPDLRASESAEGVPKP